MVLSKQIKLQIQNIIDDYGIISERYWKLGDLIYQECEKFQDYEKELAFFNDFEKEFGIKKTKLNQFLLLRKKYPNFLSLGPSLPWSYLVSLVPLSDEDHSKILEMIETGKIKNRKDFRDEIKKIKNISKSGI